MKQKTCDICGLPKQLWKAKTKTEPSACKDCYFKNKPKKYEKVPYKPKAASTSPSKSLDDKTHPELLKLAQIVFNKFIRQRDSQDGYFTCISSGDRLPVSQMQAGHLFPVSTSSMLRFDEDNVHGQSIEQNCFNPNHQASYRKNVVERIGRFNLERLESLQHCEKKWSKEELIEIINKYK